MKTFRRYTTLFRNQMHVSVVLAMQYRFEFFFKGVTELCWFVVTFVPLIVVFTKRQVVAGWSWPEALIVLGWFSLLKAILDAFIRPSLTTLADGVRTGTLDFILLKPADPQFLVSTARFEPWPIVDVVGALGILVYAFVRLGRLPRIGDIAIALVLFLLAVLLLYSLWILLVSTSFWVVRLDNLSSLFTAVFDAGRWPINVFSEVLRFIFTVIIPLALMTTYPALALMGRLTLSKATLVLLGGLGFCVAARAVWKRALRHYTSAS